jgi:hypothetical protein
MGKQGKTVLAIKESMLSVFKDTNYELQKCNIVSVRFILGIHKGDFFKPCDPKMFLFICIYTYFKFIIYPLIPSVLNVGQ